MSSYVGDTGFILQYNTINSTLLNKAVMIPVLDPEFGVSGVLLC